MSTEKPDPAGAAPRPYALIAELSYRCPLRCPYCSNPVDYAAHAGELTTADWLRVLEEAEALGALQVHLTGGEPLARKDLEIIAGRARALGLYVNLITSAIPLSRDRLEALRDAGVENVQISFQGTDAARANHIAGYPGHAAKLEAARWVKELGLPLTVNVVLHKDNLDDIDAVIALAEGLHADRLELANTQYLGWALENRDALLPSRAQLARAFHAARAARDRLIGAMEILYVTPDYFTDRPRACMSGWGQRFLHVAPDGAVLPCHAARSISWMRFDNVREWSLGDIWRESEAFQAFRGEGWMKEPCASCPSRTSDFGGCRCQAFALTGDAAKADPTCALAPDHGKVREARARAAGPLPELESPRVYLYRGPTRGASKA